MTAIVLVGGPWGALLAADGRVTPDNAAEDISKFGPDHDHIQKVFPTITQDGSLAYALAGFIGDNDKAVNLVEESQRAAGTLSGKRFGNLYQYMDSFCGPLLRLINQREYFPAGRQEGDKWPIVSLFVGGVYRGTVFYSCRRDYTPSDGKSADVYTATDNFRKSMADCERLRCCSESHVS